MRARDEVQLSALRQALTAVSVAETSGDAAVVLSDDQVVAVLVVEARKHHEAAEAFAGAGRTERAESERAEAAVLERYLPAALSDEDLQRLVAEHVAAAAAEGVSGMKAMGRVVAAVRANAGPSADGARIAALGEGGTERLTSFAAHPLGYRRAMSDAVRSPDAPPPSRFDVTSELDAARDRHRRGRSSHRSDRAAPRHPRRCPRRDAHGRVQRPPLAAADAAARRCRGRAVVPVRRRRGMGAGARRPPTGRRECGGPP